MHSFPWKTKLNRSGRALISVWYQFMNFTNLYKINSFGQMCSFVYLLRIPKLGKHVNELVKQWIVFSINAHPYTHSPHPPHPTPPHCFRNATNLPCYIWSYWWPGSITWKKWNWTWIFQLPCTQLRVTEMMQVRYQMKENKPLFYDTSYKI